LGNISSGYEKLVTDVNGTLDGLEGRTDVLKSGNKYDFSDFLPDKTIVNLNKSLQVDINTLMDSYLELFRSHQVLQEEHQVLQEDHKKTFERR